MGSLACCGEISIVAAGRYGSRHVVAGECAGVIHVEIEHHVAGLVAPHYLGAVDAEFGEDVALAGFCLDTNAAGRGTWGRKLTVEREVVAADAAGYMPRPRNLRCGRRGQQHEIQHEAGRQSFHDGFHKQRVSLVMVDQRYSLTRNFRSQK